MSDSITLDRITTLEETVAARAAQVDDLRDTVAALTHLCAEKSAALEQPPATTDPVCARDLAGNPLPPIERTVECIKCGHPVWFIHGENDPHPCTDCGTVNSRSQPDIDERVPAEQPDPAPLDPVPAAQDCGGVYEERDRLVCALSKVFPAHLVDATDADEGWSSVVIVDLPTGQVSWHISDIELPWFDHLERKQNDWDGHSTVTKYQRLHLLERIALVAPPVDVDAVMAVIKEYGDARDTLDGWGFLQDGSKQIAAIRAMLTGEGAR